jgi:hypothetical protein
MVPAKKFTPAVALGIACILLGILTNKWFLAALVSEDGNIESRLFSIIVFCLNAFLIIAGAVILKRDPERLKKDLANVATLAATLLFCILGCEAFLRVYPVAAIQEPETLGLFVDNPNGTGSYRVKPNLNINTRVGDTVISISTNSRGMRWREVSYDNPLNKERIAFVGDSFTFGLWADKVENTFVGIFESSIDKQRYEVLNFGVGGYGLWDINLQIKEEVLPFKPDFLFLIFFNGNDFRDTYLSANKFKIVEGVAKFDTLNYNALIPQEFRKDENKTATEVFNILESFRLYNLLVVFFENVIHALGDEKRSFIVSENFGAYTFWSKINYPDVAIKAVNKSLDILEEIWRTCLENNIKLIVVTIPFEEQVYAKEETGSNYDIRLPQSYIEEFSERHFIPYLDLLPILRSHVLASDMKVYLDRDIHFNNNGHRIIGTTLASFFHSFWTN